MKISFVSCHEQPIDFFTELIAVLQEELVDLEPAIYYVPSLLDLPWQVKQCAEQSDLVFVSFLYEKIDEKIKLVLEKLVDLEMETGTRLIKALEESAVEELLTEEERTDEKDRLAKKWAEVVINVVHYPERFSPEYSEEEA